MILDIERAGGALLAQRVDSVRARLLDKMIDGAIAATLALTASTPARRKRGRKRRKRRRRRRRREGRKEEEKEEGRGGKRKKKKKGRRRRRKEEEAKRRRRRKEEEEKEEKGRGSKEQPKPWQYTVGTNEKGRTVGKEEEALTQMAVDKRAIITCSFRCLHC